jgi:hypothetical protein
VHPLPWPIEDALPEPGGVIPFGPELAGAPEPEPELPTDPEDELIVEPPPVEPESEPEDEPELEDGFAVLRELLASEDGTPVEEPDDDEWVTAEEHALQVAEVARLTAELETVRESLAGEWQRSEDLKAELDEMIGICDQWEAQAVGLRADLDEVEAENRSLRIELERLHETVDEWEGEERRAGGPDLRSEFEQLSQGERRRGLTPRAGGGRRRPLRARVEEPVEDRWAEPIPERPRRDEVVEDVFEVEPADTEAEEDATLTSYDLVTGDWSDRLRQVGDAASAWSHDDLERLRGQ